jgi:nucleoside-diphosphate-sugar epimerase
MWIRAGWWTRPYVTPHEIPAWRETGRGLKVVQSVSIIGCGYTGRRLAERLRQSGAHVRGFASRAESLQQIAADGTEALRLDLDSAVIPMDFARHLVYYAVPPARAAGDPRLDRFLEGLLGKPQRIIYFSSTGVYGNQDGARVTEATAPAPNTERAARRLAAETTLRTWAEARGVSWCVLRVSGIYGPGRLPLDRLRRSLPAIVAHEANPGNRIHVTDLVTAAVAAGFAAAADRKIYNVTDGSDDSHTEYLERVARIAHLPLPPLITRAEAQRLFSPIAYSFLAESRRVDNGRMLAELGVSLQYHDLDAGICSSLAATDLESGSRNQVAARR